MGLLEFAALIINIVSALVLVRHGTDPHRRAGRRAPQQSPGGKYRTVIPLD